MSNNNLKLVKQEDATGCGIACAAMLAGTTYHATKKRAKVLGIFSDDVTLNSDLHELRPLLASYNIRIGKKLPFRGWNELPSRAILAINYKDRADIDSHAWHWAIFHRGESSPVVLDPRRELKRNVRFDLGKIKPKWYVPVADPGHQGSS